MFIAVAMAENTLCICEVKKTEELRVKHMISSDIKCTQWRMNCERLKMTKKALSRRLWEEAHFMLQTRLNKV